MSLNQVLKKIFIGEKEEVKHLEIDPNSIRDNATIKAQQNQIAELQVLLAKKVRDEALLRQSQNDVNEEEIIKQSLKEQEFELSKKSLGQGFSMRLFWASYFGIPLRKAMTNNTLLAKKLRFTTYFRDKDIAPFGDIVISGDRIILTTDDNKQVMAGESLRTIFQSPEALGNDVMTGKIPLCLDKDNQWVENIELWKPEQYVYDKEKDSISIKPVRKQPYYQILAEKENKIASILEKLEIEQLTNIKLQNKINDLKIAIKLSDNNYQIVNNERSLISEEMSQIKKVFYRTQQDLFKLQNLSVIDQDNIMKLERELKILRSEAERQNSTTDFMDMLSKIENLASLITKSGISSVGNKEKLNVSEQGGN